MRGKTWRVIKGYNTGVVDSYKDGDASHDAGPLPLELVRLSQMTVEAGVQQADNSCEDQQIRLNYATKAEIPRPTEGKSCQRAAVTENLLRRAFLYLVTHVNAIQFCVFAISRLIYVNLLFI